MNINSFFLLISPSPSSSCNLGSHVLCYARNYLTHVPHLKVLHAFGHHLALVFFYYWWNRSNTLLVGRHDYWWVSLVENPLFCNYVFNYYSITNKVKTTHIIAIFFTTKKYFLQMLTNNVKKYKSKVKLQSKVYATCQHRNNSHYVPLLVNLVENYSTNIIEGSCQLHLTNGRTSSTN
jgi:hypothetical protein